MQRLLSGMEEQEIRDRIKRMDAVEIATACEEIPTTALLAELTRRCTMYEQQIAECRGVLECGV